MSQGSNSSGGGGSGNTVATSVITQAGVEVNLSESPLVYSDPKNGFDEHTKEVISQFVKDAVKYKSERGIILDANGNQIGDVRVGKVGSVYNPTTMDTEITGHTHARGKGQEDIIGGTFSIQRGDMSNFVNNDHANTKFAVGPEGTYSITKKSNWDGQGFLSYMTDQHKQRQSERANRMKPYGQALNRGDINYTEYTKINHADFNRFLVDLHNDMLAGQKKYGYSYGLDPSIKLRRGK